MDTSVGLALIAAGASLVVASISLVTAVISNRLTSRATASLEILKQSLSRSTKTKEFADQELTAALIALKNAMQAVQSLKDEIQLIDHSVGGSLESAEAISRTQVARESISKIFQADHPLFSEIESKVLHQAKNLALEVYGLISSELRGQKYVSALSNESRERLRNFRSELSEVQSVLREARSERILHRTFEVT